MRRIEGITAAGLGIVFVLSGAKILTENPSAGKTITEPAGQPSEHLIPVPCTEPMPWEPRKNSNDATGQTTLTSIKIPEPTPERNQPECWQVIPRNGTVFPQSSRT